MREGVCAGAALLAGLALGPAGCTFAFLEGNGPAGREACAARLPAASQEELAAWKADAFRRHWLLGTRSRVEAVGYTVHSGASFPWTALAGRANESTFVEPAPEHREELRSVVWRADGCGVLGILATSVWSRWYEYPSGECFMSSRWTFLGGPLLVFGSDVDAVPSEAPAEGKPKPPDWTSRRLALKDLKYNTTTFACLGLGLLACGSRNGRAYAQLLWVPVPLWSVR